MFRMSQEVDEWFRHIADQKPFEEKFDLYYLCLLLGLSTGRREDPENARDLVDYFIERYWQSRRYIVGLMLVAELKRSGIELTSQEEVQDEIKQYLDPDNPSKLTKEGFKRLNAYAYGGFNYLRKHNGRPRHVDTFLQRYVQLLTKSINENEPWKSFQV